MQIKPSLLFLALLIPSVFLSPLSGRAESLPRDNSETPTYLSSATRLRQPAVTRMEPQVFVPTLPSLRFGNRAGSTAQGPFPWKQQIVTTVFWIGERPTANNPVPNLDSSWDQQWTENYGGYDNPQRSARRGFIPANFVPKQNPFYIALPYNDLTRSGFKPEASKVIPWFNAAYRGTGQSVLKGRWVAIRKGNRVCYAQWEDCGPFRTDHWQYVFGNERPKANLNRGAGLDVSPAVRDFLGIADTDVTDWKFVEFSQVPRGPWAQHGDNNTFVQRDRKASSPLAKSFGRPTVVVK